MMQLPSPPQHPLMPNSRQACACLRAFGYIHLA